MIVSDRIAITDGYHSNNLTDLKLDPNFLDPRSFNFVTASKDTQVESKDQFHREHNYDTQDLNLNNLQPNEICYKSLQCMLSFNA